MLSFSFSFAEIGRMSMQSPKLIQGQSLKVEEASEEELLMLSKEAKEAIDYLLQIRLPGSPEPEKKEEEEEKAREAFRKLDNLVFFCEGWRICQKPSSFLEKEKQEIAARFYGDGNEGEFRSNLRLCAFQGLRKDMLATFPEEVRYLFPWYSIFGEEDVGILWDLIAHYNKIRDPKRHKELPQELQERAFLYYGELALDKELREAIAKEHKLLMAIGEAVSSSLAIQLFAKIEDMEIPYPEDLLECPFGALASRVLKDRNEDRLSLALMAGLCSEGLSDEVRMKLFRWVEENLPKAELRGGVLAGLTEWAREKKISQQWLRNLYALWFEKMRKAREQIENSVLLPVTEGELCQLALAVIAEPI